LQFFSVAPDMVQETFHLLEPPVQLELLHAFAYEFFDETQAGQLALYGFPRLWEVLLVRAVATVARWRDPFTRRVSFGCRRSLMGSTSNTRCSQICPCERRSSRST
jgi:hypothetical protein